MDFLRTWFLGVAGAAMVGVFALAVTPPGAVRKVTQIAAALLLATAVLRPFIGLTVPQSLPFTGVREAALEEPPAEILSSIIAGKTAAYIVTKAQAVGLAVSVTARCRVGEIVPEPWAVTVYTDRPEHAKNALGAMIASDLGIPPERQTYLNARYTPDEKEAGP
ncbi:MAG: hypothetical protein LBI19_00060 [Oscillospiraceae bacterium]|jgi:hypothetical protein|nr:hypothetical protein [Oscillospiraceae bacterium]